MKKMNQYAFIAIMITTLAACVSDQDLIKKRCESINYKPDTDMFNECVSKEVSDIHKAVVGQDSNRADQFLPSTAIPGVN